MTRFSFAGLLGASPRATAATAAEDEDVKAIGEDEEAPATEDEDVAADEDTAAEDEPAADDETPAARRAFRRGVAAERARACAILDKATPATVAMAAMAIAEGVTARQAASVMSAAPAAAGADRLAAAMRGRDPAPLATGTAAAGSDLPPELKAVQARRLAQKKGR